MVGIWQHVGGSPNGPLTERCTKLTLMAVSGNDIIYEGSLASSDILLCGLKVCRCAIGMKNGIKILCLSPVEEGKNSCLVRAHANRPKAMTAPAYAWCVTTTLYGRAGGGWGYPEQVHQKN
jgi:hypothetical protein